MTCIAVCKNRKGKILMAGDRRLTFDWSQALTMPGAKIKKDSTGVLIGAAGSGNLCTVITAVMDVPEVVTEHADIYMLFTFKKSLDKALKIAEYVDEHHMLKIPLEDSCSALVAVLGRVFMVDVRHPDEYSGHGNILSGIIEIEEAPLPYAVGCGASSALPILIAERRREGYSTKEHLKLAMEIAADISPGCNDRIDIIQED